MVLLLCLSKTTTTISSHRQDSQEVWRLIKQRIAFHCGVGISWVLHLQNSTYTEISNAEEPSFWYGNTQEFPGSEMRRSTFLSLGILTLASLNSLLPSVFPTIFAGFIQYCRIKYQSTKMRDNTTHTLQNVHEINIKALEAVHIRHTSKLTWNEALCQAL